MFQTFYILTMCLELVHNNVMNEQISKRTKNVLILSLLYSFIKIGKLHVLKCYVNTYNRFKTLVIFILSTIKVSSTYYTFCTIPLSINNQNNSIYKHSTMTIRILNLCYLPQIRFHTCFNLQIIFKHLILFYWSIFYE